MPRRWAQRRAKKQREQRESYINALMKTERSMRTSRAAAVVVESVLNDSIIDSKQNHLAKITPELINPKRALPAPPVFDLLDLLE